MADFGNPPLPASFKARQRFRHRVDIDGKLGQFRRLGGNEPYIEFTVGDATRCRFQGGHEFGALLRLVQLASSLVELPGQLGVIQLQRSVVLLLERRFLRTTAYSDASMRAPLGHMGVALTAFNAQGALVGTYNSKTDANGNVLWTFNTQYPWGTQFSVNVRTDDGGNRTYKSTELGCYGGA